MLVYRDPMAVEHLTGTPGLGLSGIVIGYAGFSQRERAPVRFRELPVAHVPVILDLGEGWSIADPRRPGHTPERFGSFASGLTEGPVIVGHEGSARCLQVDLTPLGARRLLGVPMGELANRCVALGDLLGSDGDRLVERLADAPDWQARFGLIDRAITARLAASVPVGPEISWALGRVSASGGRLAIGELARDLGWSHRRLIACFRENVGLAPKAFARVVRFERLTALLSEDPGLGLARVAASCGFSDQAHLAREVRDLAGLTPTALLAEGVNSIQERSPTAS